MTTAPQSLLSVRRVAVPLYASFRRHLAISPLHFAHPSPPSGLTLGHARTSSAEGARAGKLAPLAGRPTQMLCAWRPWRSQVRQGSLWLLTALPSSPPAPAFDHLSPVSYGRRTPKVVEDPNKKPSFHRAAPIFCDRSVGPASLQSVRRPANLSPRVPMTDDVTLLLRCCCSG